MKIPEGVVVPIVSRRQGTPPVRPVRDPDADVNMSYSQMRAFRQCPLKWELAYVYRFRNPDTPARLDLGTAWHKVREVFSQAQIDGFTRKEAVVKARYVAEHIREILPSGNYDDGVEELLLWMFDDYVVKYEAEDAGWEPIHVELMVRVPLLTYNRTRVFYKGYIDEVLRNRRTGRIKVRDHKTQKGKDVSGNAYQEGLRLEDQFILYNAALQRLGYDVASVEHDGVRTDRLKREMTLSERFHRTEIFHTPAEIETVWREFADDTRRLMAVERGTQKAGSSPNPGTCSWSCDFLSVHLTARGDGRDPAEVAQSYGFHAGTRRTPEEMVEAKVNSKA